MRCLRFFLSCSWRLLWLALLLPTLAPAQVLVLRSAQAEITVDGATTQKFVTLPFLWEREIGLQSGRSVFDINFLLEPTPEHRYAMSLPRLANGYEISLNGVLLDRFGDTSQHYLSDAKLPRLLVIPPGVLGVKNNLHIVLRSDSGRQSALAAITVGPLEQVEAAHHSLWLWRVLGRQMVALFSAVIALIGLVLWISQTTDAPDGTLWRDRIYLYGWLAELFWTFRVADSVLESPAFTLIWWTVMSSLALGAWGCLTILFCMEAIGWGRAPAMRAVRVWLGLLMVCGLMAAPAGWVYGRPLVLTLWYGALGTTFLVFGLAMAGASLRRGAALNLRLLSFAVLFNVLIGMIDLYRLRISPSTEGSTSLYFSSVLFGLVAGFIVIMRFRTASQQARNSTRNLNEIVRQREAELHHSYQQLEQMAREQERATERTRILRDMHDGVGAHLSTAIRQLEFGQASRTEVLHTLHDSMDQLKLTIDAMNLPPGDLTALLANLRYRLEPRLKTAGIELLWGVQQVPLLPWLDAAAMRHVQFIVFEVISNALQHARATRLGIELCGTPEGGARLKMTDNGCGFDLHNVKLQGLSSLRSRAKALKVQLHLSSVPGQTVVQISWSLPGQPAALDAGEY